MKPQRRRLALIGAAGIAIACGAGRWQAGEPNQADAAPPNSLDEAVRVVQDAPRRPLADYTGGPGPAVFGKAPAPVVEEKTVKVAPPAPPPAPVPVPPPAPDPLAGFVFSGLVTVDGQPYALLVNRATGQGEYVAVGEEFQGFRVAGIDRSGVTLTSGEGPRQLALNQNYSLTPLSKDGAGDTAPVTPAPDGIANRWNTVALNNSDFMVSYKIAVLGGEPIDKLHDEYYAGKISMDELNRRATRGGSFLTNGLMLRSKMTGAMVLEQDTEGLQFINAK